MKMMMRMIVGAWVAMLASIATASVATDCRIGAYRLSDGGIIDVAPGGDGGLRWRRFDGATGALPPSTNPELQSNLGWTGRPDGHRVRFGDCGGGRIWFDGRPGRRIPLDVVETVFHSNGTPLAGRLVAPAGRGEYPVVVLLHGSERSSALNLYALQRLLPAKGIGAFVYDKRGTGASSGQYTQNFQQLADDAVAAVKEAKRLGGSRIGRIGLQAGSQGGWVAPIAASRYPVDFVIVSFGLAVSVVEEDRQQVELSMSLKGHGPAETAKALELADAARQLFTSDFTAGFERFDRLRASYSRESWFKDMNSDFVAILGGSSIAEIKSKSAALRWATPFNYDPLPTIAGLQVPQLWILGGEDVDAPSKETSLRLRSLIERGSPITLAVYPHAEHGMTEFEIGPQGDRLSTRYATDYFKMLVDFSRFGQLRSTYGDSLIVRCRRRCTRPRS